MVSTAPPVGQEHPTPPEQGTNPSAARTAVLHLSNRFLRADRETTIRPRNFTTRTSRYYLAIGATCLAVGVAIQAVWSDSGLVHSLSVALLVGFFLFIGAAYADVYRNRARRQ
jgi:uncharacterized membrane protein